MKLAQALIRRADAQRRVSELCARLERNAKVQEGIEPSETPKELLRQLDTVLTELQVTIQRINRTNAATVVEEGTTLTDALAERDVLKLRRSSVVGLIASGVIKQDRYSKSEIRFSTTFDVKRMQKEADELARRYRELDERIQALNWSTDLLD